MRDLIKANAALLFAAIASFILMGAGQSLYGPTLPAYARAFGLDVSTAGLLVSAHWIGCALGVGTLYIYTNATPRHVLAAMLAGSVLMAAGLGFATVLLGGVLFGAGYGAATVVFNPRVLHAFGPRGPAMVSMINAAFGIGAIAAPLVFVALGSNPRPTFLICAVLIAVTLVFAGIKGADPQETVTTDAGAFRPHWPILAFHAVVIAAEASFIGLGTTALIRAGLTEVDAAETLSLFFVGFLLARVTLTLIAHAFDALILASTALLGAALGGLIAAMAAPAFGFVVMGYCTGMFFPSVYVAASRTMGGHARTTVAIISAGMVGGIVAPLILSPLLPYMGLSGLFWLAFAVCGALACCGFFARSTLLGPRATDPAA